MKEKGIHMTHVRSEIPAKYKWDLTGIYKTEAEF